MSQTGEMDWAVSLDVKVGLNSIDTGILPWKSARYNKVSKKDALV